MIHKFKDNDSFNTNSLYFEFNSTFNFMDPKYNKIQLNFCWWCQSTGPYFSILTTTVISTCNVHQEPKTYWSLTTPLRLTTSFLPNLTSCRLMLMENLSMPTLSLKLQWSRMSQVLKDLWSWGRSEQHLTPVQKLYRWQVVSDPMGAKLTGWSQPVTRKRIYYSIATLFIN